MVQLKHTHQPPALNPLAVIDRIISDVELTATQYEEAKSSYEAVGKVLLGPNSPVRFFSPEVFPQGSMRLGTTVRPIAKDHFDLDMVCWLKGQTGDISPHDAYEYVWNAIGSDETYRQMRRRKNRCIRLDYAVSRKFHLDITPAVPDTAIAGKSLLVPDRERRMWCPSHPVGFADEWFKPASLQRPRLVSMTLANDARLYGNLEELPEQSAFEKTPLQRIVQMLKRTRDEHFANDTDHRPSSILLTTITTHSYLESVRSPANGLFQFILSVIAKLPTYVQVLGVGKDRSYSVINPVNKLEDFAEGWTHEHYYRFTEWHRLTTERLNLLSASSGRGVDVMLQNLAKSFGKERVLAAANSLGAETNEFHRSGGLRVDKASGRIGAAGSIIPATVYFGR